MGDIAEMMLDGTLCGGCGVYIEGEAPGFPRPCVRCCAADRAATETYQGHKHQRGYHARKAFECSECGKRFRTKQGVSDHARDVHKGGPDE